MRKTLAVYGAMALLGLGGFAAVAIADTTGTTEVCATATAGSHTVDVDGAPVTTVGGDTSTNCATTTYTIPTVTDTVTTTETVTTAAPTATTTATTAPATTTTPAPATGGTPGIGALEEGGHLTVVSNPSIYSMLVGSAWGSDITVAEKGPGRGLAYFDGTDVSANYSTGVTYADASANGWLLKSSTGALLTNSTFSTYCVDVGSSGYQAKWISNVESYLASHVGLDGIFIDNVLYDPKADCGAYPAKYPSTAAWDTAMVGFAKAVYTALNAKGYYVALNAGAYISGDPAYNDGTSVVSWWKMVGPYSSGLMNEFYDETAQKALRTSANAWYGNFDGWQRLIGVAQGMGKDFLGLTKSAGFNATVATYGKASFLLEWDGGGSAYIYQCGTTCDPTSSTWTTDIGTPAAAKVAIGVGYERAYTKGTVLVNPSPTSSQTFTVNGTSYTLAPTTAKILTS